MRTRVRETNKLKWFYLFYRPKASRYYRCFTKYNHHIKYTKARLHDSTAPRTACRPPVEHLSRGSRVALSTRHPTDKFSTVRSSEQFNDD
jgi:hypothetical protein